MNPHEITKSLEREIGKYTGAPFVVCTNSCTMALLLAVAWHLDRGPTGNAFRKWEDREDIEIPKRTYVSVPMSIIHAGGRPTFRDENWIGAYQLKPLPVWDSARWFTGGMYRKLVRNDGGFVCVSFHATKTLADTQGGAILHDNPEADAWFRRARFDGRTEGVPPKDDHFDMFGWHCYLSPDVSARLLWALSVLPKHNDPLPNDPYPDLSIFEVFK